MTSLPGREGVCLFDARGAIAAADGRANQWIPEAPDGCRPTPLMLADLVGEELAAVWLEQLFELETAQSVEATLRVEGSRPSLVDVELRRLDGPAGPLAVATFRRSEVETLLFRDALTGLPDRRAIGPCVAGWQREGIGLTIPYAVLFLDLNDFKRVNDARGHAAGDAVLTELADRWSSTVRDGDLVTRYGGDEFVILLKNVADREAAEPVVERLRVVTLAPIGVCGTLITLTATIGVALSDGVDAPIEHLIVAADEDMYARKRQRPK